MKVSHSINIYYTHTNTLHHPSQLCKFHPVWTAKIHSMKKPNHPEHVCQTHLKQEQVLKLIIAIKGITLTSNRTEDQIQNIDINLQMHHWHCTEILTQDLINTKKNRRDNIHSNNNGITLQRPIVKCKTFATKSFKYSASALWNQLPRTITESPNLDNFKKKLKKLICSGKHSTSIKQTA